MKHKLSSQGHETQQFDWLNDGSSWAHSIMKHSQVTGWLMSQTEITRSWNTATGWMMSQTEITRSWNSHWLNGLSSWARKVIKHSSLIGRMMGQLTVSWNTARRLAEWVKLSSQGCEPQQFHWLNDKSSWDHKVMQHSSLIGWMMSQAELTRSWNTARQLAEWGVKLSSQGHETQHFDSRLTHEASSSRGLLISSLTSRPPKAVTLLQSRLTSHLPSSTELQKSRLTSDPSSFTE